MISALAGLVLWFGSQAFTKAQTASQTPDFKEVFETVRSNLTGVSEADLNRAAVEGFVTALGPKVKLLGEGAESGHDAAGPPLTKTSLFDGAIAYVRIGQVADGLAQKMRETCARLTSSNKLNGLVLDLRYAGGEDYAAAAAVGDLFQKSERPLLNWGTGMVQSKEKTDAINLPVAVLVNRQTVRAAEALAGLLRETGTGLILGSQTAGEAMVARDFTLKSGERLRIATGSVQLGDGSALPTQGLKPDISVEVSPSDERLYFSDAFKVPASAKAPSPGSLAASTNQATATNLVAHRVRNEADLVRERRDGNTLEEDSPRRRGPEPERPVVRDPALARALDLLKGLAVVRQARS